MTNQHDLHNDYQTRIQKVLEYIRQHLSEPLDVARLAEIGNFSVFHFHRIIRAYLNEPLGAYIKRVRMETAAQLLTYSHTPIHDLSYQMGYELPSSFSHAFRKYFGKSPQAFREQQQQFIKNQPQTTNTTLPGFVLTPKIIDLPAQQLLSTRILGKYETSVIQKAWQKLMTYVFAQQLFYPTMEMFGISHDHPEIAGDILYQYEACVTLAKPVASEGEFVVKTLPAGKYAMFTYQGSYAQLDTVYNLVLKQWLFNSSYSLREAPIFDQYLNTPDNTPEEELLTKIFLPITF
ncbi:AraC family transcriptional regulator [Microscilla marina]|uniref:Transcriptional regulator, AraC-type n=1 Tax=Microscilla marina ATCC 23134 TaxID=313606 RepID=A1ZL96_MICM2|nr:AraC family transcriptional regulator [Microscilla marina]EAY28650.1 transcriptional regulator, AraC-type [Microscilla marina ATCC 23134]